MTPFENQPEQAMSLPLPTPEDMVLAPGEHPGFVRRVHQAAMVGVRAVQVAIVAGEISPANEVVRYGALGYAQLETGNPVLSAAAYGVTTLAVEGAGALAASGLLESNGGQRFFGWINRKTKGKLQRSAEEGSRITPAVEASLALYVGTPAVLAAKQLENPERTLAENRRHGTAVAAALSGYLAVEGYVAATATEGIDNPWLSAGLSLAGAIGLSVAGTWLHKRIKAWRQARRGE